MKLYVTVCLNSLENLLQLPMTTETLTMVYSEEGIFEIRQNKVFAWTITDGDVCTTMMDGVEVTRDESTVTCHEVWQIPMPYHAVEITRYTFDEGAFVLEQGKKNVAYFTKEVNGAWFRQHGCNCGANCRYCRS